MIKKLVAVITLLGLIVMSAPGVVSAHVLQSDGNIGAVMHIDPNDDPTAGQPSSLYFEFKDKQSKFGSENCDCQFIVLRQDAQIYTQPLFQNAQSNTLNAFVQYTFPTIDVYQIKVTGKPLTPNAFQPFALTYNVRVSRTTSTTSNHSSNTLVFGMFTLIGLGCIGLFVLIMRKNKARSKKTTDKPDEVY
jgi:hypothetical protein